MVGQPREKRPRKAKGNRLMNARLARLMFSSAISQNFVILRLARESGEPKDPSSFFLSLIAILRRSANSTCHRVSFRKLFAPEKSAVHSCATYENSVILSEAKDPSFFSLSTAAIFRTRFSVPRQRFPFSASPSSVPPQWRPFLAFSPPFSVPLCLRGKSLFAGARQ